jgi:ABC-type phosphate transport system permease subunit
MFVISLALAFAVGVGVGIWLSEQGRTTKQKEKTLKTEKENV